jgi:dTMP kinase
LLSQEGQLMFVVFEGIDGSGKTSISNRTARALRAAGLVVCHVREGGKLASPVAQSIRAFGRDERQLGLCPHAELLLYLARESQLLDEVTRPALAGADVVIADRFVYSAEVLACAGRGLAPAEVHPLVEAASRRMVPDLVILIDVDPGIAHARRRIAKIVAQPSDASPSRKGQAGVGLLRRMRDGYREMAARDPARWIVIDNSELVLQAVVDTAVLEVRRLCEGAGDCRRPARAAIGRAARTAAAPTLGPGEARPALLDWVDGRAKTEPALAAYMLAGLSSAAVDQRRFALAERAPEVTAWSLRGLVTQSSWRLRQQLVQEAPRQVARSLEPPTPPSDQREALRRKLAAIVPAEVAESLWGEPSTGAFALREDLFAAAPDAVMSSLATLADLRAWAIRERWLAARGSMEALARSEYARVACRSVAGLDDERAWQIRAAAQPAAPTAALASLRGLTSARAWRWREQALAFAPKAVLGSLTGMDDPRAWALREAAAYRSREAVESARGLDGPRAWRLRDSCADLWPSTVIKSLGGLAGSRQGLALVARQLVRHADDISVLKHAAAVELATPSVGATRAA